MSWSRRSQKVHRGLGEAITLAATIYTAGTNVTTSWLTLADLTGINYRLLRFVNTSDRAVFVSLDGGTTEHLTVQAGKEAVVSFSEIGRYWSGSVVKIKTAYAEAANPSSGLVSIERYY